MRKSKFRNPARIVPDDGVVEVGGVRFTAESGRQPSAAIAGSLDHVPLVDGMTLEAVDGNDGKQDGDLPSYTMPPFANGPDVRKR